MIYKMPDKKRALDLISSAKEEIVYTLSLEISEKSANTIVRNIYESFRMLGESILIAKGVKETDHVASINELLKINIETSRPKYLIENLRKLRHSINYYGYKASVEEAKDTISIAKSCFNPLFNEINKIIDK